MLLSDDEHYCWLDMAQPCVNRREFGGRRRNNRPCLGVGGFSIVRSPPMQHDPGLDVPARMFRHLEQWQYLECDWSADVVWRRKDAFPSLPLGAGHERKVSQCHATSFPRDWCLAAQGRFPFSAPGGRSRTEGESMPFNRMFSRLVPGGARTLSLLCPWGHGQERKVSQCQATAPVFSRLLGFSPSSSV